MCKRCASNFLVIYDQSNAMFQLAEADIAAQARQTAASVSQNVQRGTKNAADSFNRFVEGNEGDARRGAAVELEKKDFWDSFGVAPGSASAKGNSSIGTSAMKGMGSGGARPADRHASNANEDWGEEKWD